MTIDVPILASAPERLEILDAEGRDLVGLWQNVFVVAMRAQPSPEWLRRIGEAQERAAARHPGGFVALAILPNIPLTAFTDEVRIEAERLTSTTPPALRAVAEVIEGKGFLAAAVRSIATGMVMLTRPPWPMRVFPTVEPAAAWLAAWVDKGARASAPRRLVEAMRHTLV